jgi:hypothetical protein
MTAQNIMPSALFFEAGYGCSQVSLPSGGVGLYFSETARDGLVANSGGGQANATLIPTMFARLTSANSGDSIKLPPVIPGVDIMILNVSGNPITVYGSGTDQIDGNGSGNPVTQMNNSVVLYSCYSAASGWASEGLATGFAASGLQTLSNASITAGTTHTQAAATPITTMMAAVTVANASDGVVLPPAVPGLQIEIANLSTNAGTLYGNGTDTVNGTAGGKSGDIGFLHTVRQVADPLKRGVVRPLPPPRRRYEGRTFSHDERRLVGYPVDPRRFAVANAAIGTVPAFGSLGTCFGSLAGPHYPFLKEPKHD